MPTLEKMLRAGSAPDKCPAPYFEHRLDLYVGEGGEGSVNPWWAIFFREFSVNSWTDDFFRESVLQISSVIRETAKIYSVKRYLAKNLLWIRDTEICRDAWNSRNFYVKRDLPKNLTLNQWSRKTLRIYHFLTWIRICNQSFINCLLGWRHVQKDNSRSERCQTQTLTRKPSRCRLAWVMK